MANIIIEEEIKAILRNAINKDGEGKRIGGENFFEATGKRLWDAKEGSFRKSGYITMNKSCPGIYYMGTTDGQVDAYYIDGDVFIAHNGQERHFVDNKVNEKIKQCKVMKRNR